MTEIGSDEQFAEVADVSAINSALRAEWWARLAEEWRSTTAHEAEDEPGEDFPDPDEAPPGDEDHPEFDPLPPA
jgi:hypothetical protein